MSTKILIADCFDTIQEGIKSLLKAIPDITIIGQTKNGRPWGSTWGHIDRGFPRQIFCGFHQMFCLACYGGSLHRC